MTHLPGSVLTSSLIRSSGGRLYDRARGVGVFNRQNCCISIRVVSELQLGNVQALSEKSPGALSSSGRVQESHTTFRSRALICGHQRKRGPMGSLGCLPSRVPCKGEGWRRSSRCIPGPTLSRNAKHDQMSKFGNLSELPG